VTVLSSGSPMPGEPETPTSSMPGGGSGQTPERGWPARQRRAGSAERAPDAAASLTEPVRPVRLMILRHRLKGDLLTLTLSSATTTIALG
jgi:hypothetical protein